MFRGLNQSINQSKIILLIGTLYFIAKTELSVLSRFKTSFFITLEFLHQVWDQLVHLVVSYLNRQLSLTLIEFSPVKPHKLAGKSPSLISSLAETAGCKLNKNETFSGQLLGLLCTVQFVSSGF